VSYELNGELDSAELSVVWLSEQQSNICNIWYTHTQAANTTALCVVSSRPAFETVNTKNSERSVTDVDQNIVLLGYVMLCYVMLGYVTFG
jgi:hypothetical protein